MNNITIKKIIMHAVNNMDFKNIEQQFETKHINIIKAICKIIAESDDDFMCVDNIITLLNDNGFDTGSAHDF